MSNENPVAKFEDPGQPLIKLLDKSDLETAQFIRGKLTAEDAAKLKLLDDPEKAKLLQKLEKLARQALRLAVNPAILPPQLTIKKSGILLPEVWPLSIDRSFWEDWAFIKWQAIRRNDFYRRAIERFYKPNPAIFQSSEISHLFQDYSPSLGLANNPFSTWRIWVIRQSLRMKTGEQMEVEITERLLAKNFTTKRVNLWPVSPLICFPHPYFLDKLRPLPFGVPIQPVNRPETLPPYVALVKTGSRKPRYFRFDISLPKDVLRRATEDYFKSLKALNLRSTLNFRSTLRNVLRQIPRRAMSLYPTKVRYWFCVWDLREAGLEFSQIAGYLFPNEYDRNDRDGYPDLPGGEKYPVIQRVQDYYDQAKLLIDPIFELPS